MTLQLTTSPDGQWVVARAGRRLALFAGNAPAVVARGELDSDDADLAIVQGPPNVVITVTRGEAATRIALRLPPKLDAVSAIEVPGAAKIATITGGRIVLLSADHRALAIVRAVGNGLASHPIELAGTPIELVVGIERDQLVVAQPKKLELWDAVSGRSLRKLALELPPPPRTAGAAAGHLWVSRPGSDEVFVYRLSDGRPFRHFAGAPVEHVIAHPLSPLLVLVTPRGLVRLHCFAHSLTPIEAPWQPGQPVAFAQHVEGEEISLLGLTEDDEAPWRVQLAGAAPGAPAVLLAPSGQRAPSGVAPAPAPAPAPITPAPIAPAPIAAAPVVAVASAPIAPAPISIAPAPIAPAPSPPADLAMLFSAVPARTPVASMSFHGAAPRPAPLASPMSAPVSPMTAPAPLASPMTAPAPIASPMTAPIVSPMSVPAPVAAPSRATWRDVLAAYGHELARGNEPAPPALPGDGELATLGQRLALAPPASRALAILYALYLVGEPALALARLARLLGDWREPLGQGQLAALALIERHAGKIQLAPAVTDALDGAAPRETRLAGGAATTPHAGAFRVARDGRTDVEIEAELATRFGRIAVVIGALAPALLEARLHGATAVTFVPPTERPRPWPDGAGLVLVLYGTASAWIADLPNLAPATDERSPSS